MVHVPAMMAAVHGGGTTYSGVVFLSLSFMDYTNTQMPWYSTA